MVPEGLSLLMRRIFPQFAATNKVSWHKPLWDASFRGICQGVMVLDTTADIALRFPWVSLAAIEKW